MADLETDPMINGTETIAKAKRDLEQREIQILRTSAQEAELTPRTQMQAQYADLKRDLE